MIERAHKPDATAAAGLPELVMPAGVPPWVTPELVRLTLRVWQPRYSRPLSVDDAVTIIQNAGRLIDALVLEG